MEDKLTNQEEQFKAVSEEFSLPIDTSELWSAIEPKLPTEEGTRRGPIVWWFAGGFVVLLFGIWAITNNSQLKEENNDTDRVEYASNVQTKKVDQQPFVKQSVITPIPSHEFKSAVTNTSLNEQQITDTTSDPEVENDTENKEYISTEINYDRYDEKSTSREDEAINQSKTEMKQQVQALINSSLSPSSDGIENLKEINNQNRDIVSILAAAPLTIAPLTNNYLFEPPLLELRPVKSTIWLPYYSFASGINLNRSTIYASDNEGLDMLQFQNEKALPGLSSIFRGGMESSSGWRFGMGISHDRLVNRNSLRATLVSTQNNQGIESSKIDDDGNVISTEGLISTTYVTQYDLKWHRVHDFVNLELSIGKRWVEKGRFSVFTDAFLSQNIWSRHTGYYFEKDAIVMERFSSEDESPYMNSGFNLGFRMDLEYRINQLSVSVSPFASLGLNSMMQGEHYYQIKNSHYGVQLGIVYRP